MLQLDDEDYELLGYAIPEKFDVSVSLELHIAGLNALKTKRNRRSEKTPRGRWLAAMRARQAYDKKRKPRVKLGGTWAERNPEAYREAHRKAALAYYHRNKQKLAAKAAEWRAKNPGYMAAKSAEHRRKKGKP